MVLPIPVCLSFMNSLIQCYYWLLPSTCLSFMGVLANTLIQYLQYLWQRDSEIDHTLHLVDSYANILPWPSLVFLVFCRKMQIFWLYNWFWLGLHSHIVFEVCIDFVFNVLKPHTNLFKQYWRPTDRRTNITRYMTRSIDTLMFLIEWASSHGHPVRDSVSHMKKNVWRI